MPMRRDHAEFETITGYILPEQHLQLYRGDVSETEDEEEDRQPEFLDMKEMNSLSNGGKLFKFSVPAKKQVKFKTREPSFWVEGRFPLCDPWWLISCKIKKGRYKNDVKGYPSYSLRTDLRPEGRSIVSLFLTACGALPDFVKTFMEWLPKDRHVKLGKVLDALQDFEESKPEHKAIAEELKSCVNHSVAGTHVKVASKYPGIMRYLPTLLPGQFMEIISKKTIEHRQNTPKEMPEEQSNTDVLAKLEELIKNDSWKLGFSHIMSKEVRLIRCEAKLEDLELCNLTIPVLQHNALLMYEEIKTFCRNTGSTCIKMENLVQKMQRHKLKHDDAKAARDFLVNEGVLMSKVCVDGEELALRNLFFYENGIAEYLKRLVEKDPWLIKLDVREVLRKDQVERLRAKACEEGSMDRVCDPAIELDSDHVKAAEMICANPVTVISGKGGSGKTTLVSLVFKEAEETKYNDRDKKPKVLLTAPTGRAASLLSKKTSFTAYTIHQVLWSFMNTKKDKSGNPQDWKFSKVRVLVVDEGSLVSVKILHSILSMLTEHAQLQKFIILGDVRQLPSIEPGNTLCDLFEGFRKVQWAIEMQTNHRAESKDIVKNAELISEMGMDRHYSSLKFDAIIDMRRPPTVLSSDNSFIFVQIGEEDIDLNNGITFLLKSAPDLKDDRRSQFVAFRRKDCDLINELCCKHYSGHTTRTDTKTIQLQHGNKVCCTKNGYITDKDKENRQEETSYESAGALHETAGSQRERLCNGEIFFILEKPQAQGARHNATRYLTLDDKNGRLVTCDYKEVQRECKLRHAWAQTIHTFQGSEAETIVYVLGNSMFQNWQHVYTAVTRGQKRVYVIGRETDLANAIKRSVIRNTQLKGLIKKIIAKQGLEGEDTQTQTESPVESPTTEVSGVGPSQSTPVTHMQNPRSSQASSNSPANGHNPETSSASLQDTMSLTQMCDEKQKENIPEVFVAGGEEAVSEGTSTPPSKRIMACKRMLSDNSTTPSKQPKS